MSYKKARMEYSQNTKCNKGDDKQDKQYEQMDKFLTQRINVPFANTIEEFFENPMGLSLKPQDLVKNLDVC